MKLNQLLELTSAPLAGIFLTLALIVFAFGHRTPEGVAFTVMQSDAFEINRCPDNLLFISLQTDNRIRINASHVKPHELTSRLRSIMSARYTHSVYVIANPSVSQSEFADLLDQIAASVSDMHIGLLPSSVQKTLETDPYAACRLDWPPHEFNSR